MDGRFPPLALKLERLERDKPKRVFMIDSFKVHVPLTDLQKKVVGGIIDKITKGESIEAHYRSGIGDGRDKLLKKRGVMHLHLERKDSKELLYLVQFPDFVLLLEVNNHKHVDPPTYGALLDRYRAEIKTWLDKGVRPGGILNP